MVIPAKETLIMTIAGALYNTSLCSSVLANCTIAFLRFSFAALYAKRILQTLILQTTGDVITDIKRESRDYHVYPKETDVAADVKIH